MEERREEQKVPQKPDRIAAPEEKSDNSPLEQAFGVGVFSEVAGDVEEDDHARRRENARVGPEIQAHLYRDSRLIGLFPLQVYRSYCRYDKFTARSISQGVTSETLKT